MLPYILLQHREFWPFTGRESGRKKKVANALLLTLSLEHVRTQQDLYSRIGY